MHDTLRVSGIEGARDAAKNRQRLVERQRLALAEKLRERPSRQQLHHVVLTTVGERAVTEDVDDVPALDVVHDARFGNAQWTTLPNGAYALHGALVSFECRVAQVSEVGTHTVFFLEVAAVHAGDPGEALVYYARKYHTLTPG